MAHSGGLITRASSAKSARTLLGMTEPRNVQKPLDQASALTLSPIDDAWIERVHAVARAHFSAADLEGAQLAAAVDAVSRGYTVARQGLGAGRSSTAALIARMKLFSVRDLPKVELPLTELRLRNALPRASSWRVLDLGAGLGATSLGVARFAKRCAELGVERLDVHAIDRDAEALRVFQRLSEDVSALGAMPLQLTTRVADLSRAPSDLGGDRFHVIVVGFVINELWADATDDARIERAQAWLSALSEHLTDDGVLIVLEPALREQTRQLQRLRDRLVESARAPYVFAPCTRSGPCPMLENERDWCHAQVPFELPSRTATIARDAGLRDHDLTFSYLTLRNQPGRVGGDADGVHRVVSAPLPSKGKLEHITCSDHGLTRVMRLDRHRSDRNAGYAALGRGALVRLPIIDDAGRIRVGADDGVEVLWRWSHHL